MTNEITLVLGGTGKTGRRVVDRHTARHLPVRVGSRSGAPPFDWNDRSTWAPALHGVSAAYISYQPDMAVPGAAETVGAFAEMAVASGVRSPSSTSTTSRMPPWRRCVQRALGRPPRDFSDNARDTAATGIWEG
jgi:hypothetical protein